MTGETVAGLPVTRGRCWYDVPAAARPGMRVPARVYADGTLWEQISKDRSLDQLLNVATLQGVVDRVYEKTLTAVLRRRLPAGVGRSRGGGRRSRPAAARVAATDSA